VPSRNVLAQSVPTPNISRIPIQSPAYRPVIIKGLTLYPDHPLQFDFIVERGDDDLQGQALRQESLKMIKYFLASLTTPQKEMWVNLSPNEPDRIIPEIFGQTEMGRDLLAQDYLLKQLTASMMYPEEELGKKFWARIYERAAKEYGTTQIPMNTFNKVWIVPEKAVVMEHQKSAFVVERKLKVMLEEDYLGGQKTVIARRAKPDEAISPENKIASLPSFARNDTVTTQLIREVIIPELEREVNEGKTFANLRQIYNAMILATWYKQALKESLLGQVYVDQNKVKGVDLDDPAVKQKIYEQYLEVFKKGVYNFIKEEVDPATQQMIPRKYFSGGLVAPEQVGTTTREGATLAQQAEAARGQHEVVTMQAGELGPDASPDARRAADAASLAGTQINKDASGRDKGSPAKLLELVVHDEDLLQGFLSDQGVSRQAIGVSRAYSRSVVSLELKMLVDLGILARPRRGYYQFADPIRQMAARDPVNGRAYVRQLIDQINDMEYPASSRGDARPLNRYQIPADKLSEVKHRVKALTDQAAEEALQQVLFDAQYSTGLSRGVPWHKPQKAMEQEMEVLLDGRDPQDVTVLNLGAGNGDGGSLALIQQGFRSIQTDFSSVAIAEFQERLRSVAQGDEFSRTEFIVGDMLEVLRGLPTASVDVVHAHLSLHYFRYDKLTQIFAEMKRVLRPNGSIVFKVFSTEDSKLTKGELELIPHEGNLYRIKSDGKVIRLFTREDIEKLLVDHGFETLEIKQIVVEGWGNKPWVAMAKVHQDTDPGPAMRRSGQGLSQAQHTVINAAIAEYFGRGHEHFQGGRAWDRGYLREEIPIDSPDYRRLDPEGVQAAAHIRIPDGVDLEEGMARERIGVVKFHLPGVLERAQELADEYYRQRGIHVEIPQDLLATVGRRRGQEYWDMRGLMEMMIRPRADRVAAAAHELEHIQDALKALREDRESADEQTIQARAPSPPRDTFFHDALHSGQYDTGRVNFNFLQDVVEDFWMQVLKYLEEGGILQRVGKTATYQILPFTPEGNPSVVLTHGIGDRYRSSLGLRHKPVDTPTGRRGITRYEEDAILHRLQQIAVLNILGDHVAGEIDADVRSAEGLIEALRLPQYVQPVELALIHLGQNAVRPLAQFLQEHPSDSRRSSVVDILIRIAQEGGDLTGIRNELVDFTTSFLAEEEPTPGAHKDLLEDILRWLLPHINLEPQDAQLLESFDGRVDQKDLEVFFRFRLPLARQAQFADQARAEALPRLTTILSQYSVWFQRLSESGFFRDFEREFPLPEDWNRARFEADWEQALGGLAREIGVPENDQDEVEGVAILKKVLESAIPRLRAHGIGPQFIAKWIWLTMFRVADDSPTVAGAELPQKFAEALTEVLGDSAIQAQFRRWIERNTRYEEVLMEMFPQEGDFEGSPWRIWGELGSAILIRPLAATSSLPAQLADHLETRFGLIGDAQPESSLGLQAIQNHAETFVDSLKDSDGRQDLASIIEEFFMDPIIRDHLDHQRFTEAVDEFNRKIRVFFLITQGFQFQPFDLNVGALTYEEGEYRWLGVVVARQGENKTDFLLFGALLDQFCSRVARHVSSRFGIDGPVSLSELPTALMETQRNVRQVVDQLRQDAGAADFINRINASLERAIASVGHKEERSGFLLALVEDINRQYFVNYGFYGFDEFGVEFRYRDGAYQLLNETVAVTMEKGVARDGSRGGQAMLVENEDPAVGGIDF
ncbi:MAG: class I SAM-dependent methyltransferase, partial [Candidatus Omnitrophica bacterium]|nr:class I SAM-dependent methyltransferase [Candidatus Omnitrophota bacterium]